MQIIKQITYSGQLDPLLLRSFKTCFERLTLVCKSLNVNPMIYVFSEMFIIATGSH